jgi:hypothetical protein
MLQAKIRNQLVLRRIDSSKNQYRPFILGVLPFQTGTKLFSNM